MSPELALLIIVAPQVIWGAAYLRVRRSLRRVSVRETVLVAQCARYEAALGNPLGKVLSARLMEDGTLEAEIQADPVVYELWRKAHGG